MLIATWNVNSIIARLPLVTRWLEAVKPDVLCLQETKVADEKFPHDAFVPLGYQCQIFGQQSYNGVAILTRDECSTSHRGYPDDDDDDTQQSRLITTQVQDINIVNVYVPNGQMVGTAKYQFKLMWMRRLREFFDSQFDKNSKVLLCGDFNVAPEERDVHDVRLWQGRILFSEEERAALDFIKAWGFTDAFRQHDERTGQYSWWDYRAGMFRRNMGLRIDHIWISEPLVALNKRCWIDKETRKWERPSDHAPVIVEF
jgi:exodeoxyribonuclease-3